MHGKTFAAGFSSLAVPSAFIYSEADTVTRVQDIETVCSEWRAAGSDVEVAVFEGTKHVMHMLADPARYEAVAWRVLEKGAGRRTRVTVVAWRGLIKVERSDERR